MMKLFDYIKDNAKSLLVVLLAFAGILSAAYYVGGMSNNVWVILSRLTMVVLSIAFFGLTITALILGKNKLANIFIGALCGYLAFVFVKDVAAKLYFTGDVLAILTTLFELLAALALVAIIALVLIQAFVDKKKYDFNKAIRIIILVYLALNIVAYFFVVVLAFNTLPTAAAALEMIYGLVRKLAYPLILVLIYITVFEKEVETKTIENNDEDASNEKVEENE